MRIIFPSVKGSRSYYRRYSNFLLVVYLWSTEPKTTCVSSINKLSSNSSPLFDNWKIAKTKKPDLKQAKSQFQGSPAKFDDKIFTVGVGTPRIAESGSYSLHWSACAHDYTAGTVEAGYSQHDLDWLQRLVEREQVLITCLRCPRGLHATTETMNLRVSRAHVYCVRANARGCPSTLHVCPKVRERERERQGVRLTTFASWPAYASVVLRPTCRSCRIRSPTSRVTLTDDYLSVELVEIDRQRQNRVGKTVLE